jgi:putative Mg2+ transporter-C (MgtC) family protein
MNFLDWQMLGSDVVRLVIAAVLGGVIGLERELRGHWAGLRTHMMVAAGACVFIIAGEEIAGSDAAAITRIVQGVATGIGFLGAGTILKLSDRLDIKGLTTASSIWLAAALGTAAGMAEYELAAAGLCVSLFVLAVLGPLENAIARRHGNRQKNDEGRTSSGGR